MRKLNTVVMLILACAIIVRGEGFTTEKDYKAIFNTPGSVKGKGSGTMCDPGPFLKLGLLIPGKNFATHPDHDNTSDERYGVGPSFEVGNYFKIVDLSNMAIGLKASWISVNYTTYSYKVLGVTKTSKYLFGSVLQAGPYFTYAIDGKMAADVYYQLAPKYANDLGWDDSNGFFGLGHTLGACFRYDKYIAGIDYGFGTLNYWESDDNDIFKDFKIRTSALRIFIGLKF